MIDALANVSPNVNRICNWNLQLECNWNVTAGNCTGEYATGKTQEKPGLVTWTFCKHHILWHEYEWQCWFRVLWRVPAQEQKAAKQGGFIRLMAEILPGPELHELAIQIKYVIYGVPLLEFFLCFSSCIFSGAVSCSCIPVANSSCKFYLHWGKHSQAQKKVID